MRVIAGVADSMEVTINIGIGERFPIVALLQTAHLRQANALNVDLSVIFWC